MQSIALKKPSQRRFYLVTLLVLGSSAVFLTLLIEPLGNLYNENLRIGSVAPQDILAPYTLTYNSEIQAEKQREIAQDSVAQVYTPLDTSVARSQLEKLRAALAFITSVRSDTFAAFEQRMADLSSLQDIRFSRDTANSILELNENRWQAVQQESIVVLEQVMRNPIRDDQLEVARQGVPALVSLSLTVDQAVVVAELVEGFVAPNSFYDDAATIAARQQAAAAVTPVPRTFMAGETIIQRGMVITPIVDEALEAFDIRGSGNLLQELASGLILTVITAAFFVVYFRRFPNYLLSLRALTIFTYLFLGFLIGAKLILPGHIVIPYAFPMVAFSLTIAVLFGRELAFVATIPLAVLIAYGMPKPIDLMLLNIFGSFFGILALQNARRIVHFLWAGAAIAISGSAIILLFRLADPQSDWLGIITLVGAASVNGMASAGLSLVLQFFIAQTLGLTTPLQLVELSRPDHPLMQFLLRNAPGTYQHSLQVANLAEQGSEYIGADALLTRVGALYHDVGKALNPYYFIENQPPGQLNPHDDLDPATSSATIIRHVPDGVALAKKYHLPLRIRQFIEEHHGTMITHYQCARALEAAGGNTEKIDIDDFRYPGPRPQSRETALIMLADGCEASVRAERPRDEIALRQTIQKVIDDRVKSEELHDSELNLRELDLIADAFTATLKGVYHPRLEYPDIDTVKWTAQARGK